MSELSAFAGSEGYGACDDEGIGDFPNKQENARSPLSRNRAVFCKCIYTCPACRFLGVDHSPILKECDVGTRLY